MTRTRRQDVRLAHGFNHDLLLRRSDQDAARERWPAIADVLVNAELIRTFSSHEAEARHQKRIVHGLGSTAVALMLVALLGYAADLWFAAGTTGVHVPYLGVLFEACAVLALILALLASRHGSTRRRWLKNRFITEVLRQWHFRRLLDGEVLDQAVTDPERYLQIRDRDFSTLVDTLTGTAGAAMDELSQARRDPIGRIPRARVPGQAEARAQLLDAYRTLRLDHQRHFAMHKLSAEDRSFLGLSLSALSIGTEQLAGTALVLALVCSVARIVVDFDWASLAAVSLAIVGVAVRAWRDGFALHAERERYQEALYVLELLTERWDSADSDGQRLHVAEEVERVAVEELRSFLRTNEHAQYVL